MFITMLIIVIWIKCGNNMKDGEPLLHMALLAAMPAPVHQRIAGPNASPPSLSTGGEQHSRCGLQQPCAATVDPPLSGSPQQPRCAPSSDGHGMPGEARHHLALFHNGERGTAHTRQMAAWLEWWDAGAMNRTWHQALP